MKQEIIIKKALLRLGFAYDDNDLEEDGAVNSASFLLNDVIMDLLCDDELAISLVKKELKFTERKIFDGEYEYIKPDDCLEILTPGVTEINGLLYSKKSRVMLEYLEKRDLKDISEKYQKLFVISLAIELARTLGKENYISTLYSELDIEKEKHLANKTKVFRLKEMKS